MAEPRYDHDLEALVRQFQASDLEELHVKVEGLEFYISRNPDAAAPIGATASAPRLAQAASPAATSQTPHKAADLPAPASQADIPEGHVVVRAPYLGTFYRAPKPGEPVFVEIGDTVAPGTDLCLVEVMKLFTAVRSDSAGVVRQVFARDGEMVAEGQPLFAIEPAS